MVCSTHRYPAHGFSDAHSLVLGGDHHVHACGIGRAQDGPEVVRILHAVENQHEWRGLLRDEGHDFVLIECRGGFLHRLHVTVFTRLSAMRVWWAGRSRFHAREI